jgi:uncharacterized damage-inducible protein DinB
MTTKELFMQTWKNEAIITQRVLNAVPNAMLDYRPDPRSRTALELAIHNSIHSQMLLGLLEKGEMGSGITPPAGLSEAQQGFSAVLPKIEKQLRAMDDKTWEGKAGKLMGAGGKVMMSAPYVTLAWLSLLDMVHHRGQLATYLRPMGGKVPSIYGASADEPGKM